MLRMDRRGSGVGSSAVAGGAGRVPDVILRCLLEQWQQWSGEPVECVVATPVEDHLQGFVPREGVVDLLVESRRCRATMRRCFAIAVSSAIRRRTRARLTQV